MARLFISYRRSDTGGYADRLSARLATFQFQAIFQDREDIALADNYADEIRSALAQCDAVLVLIGPTWTTARDKSGGKRLDSPTDWVRREISLAVSMRVPIVPVLFDSARTPSAAEVPADLAALATAQGYDINGNYFDRDADDLARRLERQLVAKARSSADRTSGVPPSYPRTLLGIAIGLFVLTVGFSIAPYFVPALPTTFWVFPASMDVPAFLYWMYLQGETLRSAARTGVA